MNTSFNVYHLFNDPAFRTMILAGIEKQINLALSLDPVTINHLCDMSTTVIDVQCSDPKFQFYVYLKKEGVRLSSYHDGEVDISLSGSIAVLASLVVMRDHRIDAVPGLESSGSADVLSKLSVILQDAEFDWKEILYQYSGNVAGHLLSRGIDFIFCQGGKTKEIMADNIKEYLQEELQFLPSRNELESLVTDMTNLQADIDSIVGFVHELE